MLEGKEIFMRIKKKSNLNPDRVQWPQNIENSSFEPHFCNRQVHFSLLFT